MPRKRKEEKRAVHNMQLLSARQLRRIEQKKKLRTHKWDAELSSSPSGSSSSSSRSASEKSWPSSSEIGSSSFDCDDSVTSVSSDKCRNADNSDAHNNNASLPANISIPETLEVSKSTITDQCSDISSNDSTIEAEATFVSDLRELLNNYPQVPGTAVTGVLKLLNQYKKTIADEIIPRSYRTLMNTPRSCLVQKLDEKTTYYYFGIESTLQKFSKILKEVGTVKLSVFIDGAEGDKTGLVHWPVLGKILGIRENVIFPIVLYSGYSKPKCIESYLREFVTEVNWLYLTGVAIDMVTRNFRLMLILGDAPARVLFLNTAQPNAFHHCLYCTICGRRHNNRNYFYEKTPCTKRNLEDFKNFRYRKLQKGYTPLMDLIDFNILEQCPYDPMHLTMRLLKTLLGFMVDVEPNKIRRKRSKFYRLKPASIKLISIQLKRMKRWIPVEFQRKTEVLEKFKAWKATQARFFLLYSCPIVLQKFVHKEVYKNFLLLHFSLRLLSMSNVATARLDQVQIYLEKFVHSYSDIYGREACTHYIHALLHLVPLVKVHGPLSVFSAYLFESYLGLFKHFKHAGKSSGQEVVNRIIERQLASRELYIKNKRSNQFPQNAVYHDGDFPAGFQKDNFITYSRINLESCTINVLKKSDNLVLLKSGRILRIQNILVSRTDSNDIYFHGYCLTERDNLYTVPEPSSLVGIYVATDNPSAEIVKRTYSVTEFSCKCIGIPLEKDCIVVESMIH